MATMTKTKRTFNFNAGPSALPQVVLEKAQAELVHYRETGMSVMEMSHRSKDFEDILAKTQADLRSLLKLSDDHAILFLGGGASLQFSMIPMNLAVKGKPIELIHTGSWTGKALEEAEKLASVNVVASTKKEKFIRIPKLSEINLSGNASYVHLASNNTIVGTEWFHFPQTGNVPLVGDMSSDILSREFDANQFGLIFAGAQKNLGPSGVTLVIIRKDLAERADKKLPTMLQYRTHIENNSLYNTPPAYSIYFMGLVLDWIKSQGGVKGIEKNNVAQAALIYNAIDKSDFYSCPNEKESRSRMNIVFRIKNGDEALEDKFVKEAKAQNMVGLKGHRSVGGLRASIYNAQTNEAVQALVGFMKEFEKKNG